MIRHRSIVSIVSFAAFSALACQPGSPEVEPQPRGTIPLPEFRLTADPVQNHALASDMVYRGSALVFDPASTPEQLSGVVAGTRDARLAKASWLKSERQVVRPLTSRMTEIKAAIAAVEAEARRDDNLRTAQAATAKAWLAHRLDEEAVRGAARAKADGVWGMYCEAKLWELALSPRIVANRYLTRPSPLQLCEDHYAANDLLTGPRCAPARTKSGLPYFGCLWLDGVMKTAFYADRFNGSFANAPEFTKASKLNESIENGELATALTDDRAPRVIEGALGLASVRLSRIFGAPFKELFVPDTGTPIDAPELALAAASPAMLISAVEDGKAAVAATALHWLPAKPWTAALTDSLKDMGARPLGDWSVSDFLFHRLGAGVPPTPPLDLPVVKNNPDFDFIFDAITPELAARLKTLGTELASVTVQRDAAATEALALFDQFTHHLTLTANAASLNGTSNTSLWINAILHVSRLADGFVEVRFSLDEVTGELARGCFDAATGQGAECAPMSDLKTTPLTVSHDPSSGGLTLTTPYDQHELRLEIHPNQIDDILYFYSGKLTILGEDEVLHQGGLNLMTD